MPDPLDQDTRLWFRQQIRGMSHSVNRCNAEYASAADLIEALTDRVAKLELQHEENQIAIGQLRDEMEGQVEKIREAYRELKNSH